MVQIDDGDVMRLFTEASSCVKFSAVAALEQRQFAIKDDVLPANELALEDARILSAQKKFTVAGAVHSVF